MRIDEKLQAGAAARCARRRHHRGRVPDRLRGRRRGGAHDRHARRRPGHCRRSRAAAPPTSTAPARRSRPPRRRRIHTFIATSDLHLERKLRMTREACLDAAVAAVHRARRYTDDVQFSAEDATRSDLDFLCRVIEEVISAGCTTVNLPDTVGYSTPDEIGAFFRSRARPRAERRPRDVQRALPRRPRPRGRQHAGRGRAPARARSSARSTASASAPGNASLEEIVMATRVRSDLLPFTTGISLARDLSRRASCSRR